METDISQDRELIKLAGCIPNVQAQVERLVIDGPPAQVKATALLKTLKVMKKTIEERRDFYVKPLNKILKFARDRAKELAAPLLEMEGKLRGGLVKYQEYLEKKEREAAAQQAKEAAEKQAELDRLAKESEKAVTFDDMVEAEEKIGEVEETKLTVVPQVHNTVRGGSGSVSFRKIWQFEVIDYKAIPRIYLDVDKEHVNKVIREGLREIPGLRIFEKTISSVR